MMPVEQIDQMIDGLLANAEQLIAEAKLLFGKRAYARTYALAHLAREELAKVLILYPVAVKLLAGHAVDWKRTMKRLQDHTSKLRQETVQAAVFMSSQGNDGVANFLRNNVALAAAYRNRQKNLALYVGFQDGKVLRPDAAFDDKRAWRTLRLAQLSLEEQLLWRAKIGPFATRKAEDFANVPDFDAMSPEQKEELFRKMGPLYARILDHLHVMPRRSWRSYVQKGWWLITGLAKKLTWRKR
jgi:AbiV family abortive infection protein